LILGVGIWYFFFNKKAPSDPEDMAEAVLETIIDEDFDAFMGMTTATLSLSEWESIAEDYIERRIEYLEKELEDAKRDEEEGLENQLETIEIQKENSDTFALGMYLRSTLDELEYDEWEPLAEEFLDGSIKALKDEIRNADDDEKEFLEGRLERLKEEETRKDDYKDWDDARERRADAWEDAFDDVYDNGEEDVDWDEVEFKKIDYDEDEREAVNDFDIEIHLTYRKDTYILELDDCIETNLGILMADTPRWKGEKISSSKSKTSDF